MDLQSGGLQTEDGRWTKQVADRVRNAVFAKAYGDERLIALAVLTPIVEGTDVILRARNNDVTVENILSQQDFFGGFTEKARKAARFMDNHCRLSRKMGEFVESELRRAQNERLFNDEPTVSVRDVFERANQVLEQRYGIEKAFPTDDPFG